MKDDINKNDLKNHGVGAVHDEKNNDNQYP